MEKGRKKIIITIALIAMILVVYWQVQGFDFLDYDDQLYVTHNYKIQHGITWETCFKAFTDMRTSNWHPLTLLSHALDWQLFGDKAGGHHWTNLIIHIFNTVLLFLLLNTMTGTIWRSAAVAALFALHPINVESVAWVAERKNVLSAFFWFLTMLLYVWYCRKPGWKRYVPVFLCFALGLMAKPMLVTLPFVLLLMDYWPLNRTPMETSTAKELANEPAVSKARWSLLFYDKIPLLLLTAISISVTLNAAKSYGSIVSFDSVPLMQRIYNAILSYALYLKKLFFPVDLAVFYPLQIITISQVLPAAVLLVVITIICCWYCKKYPYLAVGWFWYLGTLIPVIGIVQVGAQSMADRYAYIPFIGIFLALGWFVAENLKNFYIKIIAIILTIVLFLALSAATYNQVKYWRNSFSLFERALQVTKGNFVAHAVLGNELIKRGKIEEAIVHFRQAISGNMRNPADYVPLVSLANALSLQGKKTEAILTFQKALTVDPRGKDAYYRLGYELLKDGRVDEAITAYKKAIVLDSEEPSYHGSLANAHMANGKMDESIREYKEVLRIQPNNAIAHNNLGYVYMTLGRTDEAMKHFQEAIKIQPHFANAHYRLSILLKQKGLNEKALYHLNEAVKINPEFGSLKN
jgi:tetratricopeptide (TPR) repeat protein